MSEMRLKTLEKKTAHFRKPKRVGKLWQVTEFGPEGQKVFPKEEAIKKGKVLHPETGEPWEHGDDVLVLHVIPIVESPEMELTKLEMERDRLERELRDGG